MKKPIFVFLLTSALLGCAEFQPKEGMSFAEFQTMSARSLNGIPINVSRQGDLAVYVLPSSNRELSKQGNLFAKALYDPNKDMAYFFSISTGKLVKVVPVNQADSVVSEGAQAQRSGFSSLADFELSKAIGANSSQLQQLKGLGITSESSYRSAKLDEIKYQNLYNNQSDVSAVIQFLADSKIAKQTGITLQEAVKRRMAPQLAREAEAKRQLELAKEQELKAKAAQEKAAADAAAKASAAKSVLGL